MKNKKALFAISSLGLGHATRTLVIIEYYLNKGYEIDIISYGNALNYLKIELLNKKVNFIEFIDYPPIERGKFLFFYCYLIIDLIKLNIIIKKENNYIKKIGKTYDFIFSDGRYGICSKNIPSFLLIHQLSFIMPKGLKLFSKLSDYFNYINFKKFNYIFIPDYINNSIAGKLSHPKWINKLNHSYIGILSSFFDISKNEDKKIDYLFTITGYLLENKQNFIDKLINLSKNLDGTKVFILGDTKNNYIKKLDNNITIYSSVEGEKRKQLFNSANIIISRAGYTTIMDIIELDKKAILYPTPNQTEQEYLVKYLNRNNFFVDGNEKSDLIKNIKQTDNLNNFKVEFKTKKSLQNIDEIIFKYI